MGNPDTESDSDQGKKIGAFNQIQYLVRYFLKRFTRIAIIIAIYIIFILISLRQPAHSQVIDSSFYQWTVYEIQENELDYKKCYIVSHPIKSDSDHNSRQRPYVMITRFQKNRSEEVSIFGGFEFKLNGEVFALVDGVQFKITAKKDVAWARSKMEDARIIETMLNSGVMKIRSNSAIGTYAVDEYSLKGITRAYARMREICK